MPNEFSNRLVLVTEAASGERLPCAYQAMAQTLHSAMPVAQPWPTTTRPETPQSLDQRHANRFPSFPGASRIGPILAVGHRPVRFLWAFAHT